MAATRARVWRRIGVVAVVGGLGFAAQPAVGVGADPAIVKTPVAFQVKNPLDPLHGTYTIRGFLMRPAGCTTSVILALHGLSYGQWAWDFPLRPETYSVARALAARGYATIAIDELGYGSSEGKGSPRHPNGYTLTVESYAAMTGQILRQIRAGGYGGPAFHHVGLMGHSAGTEIAEETAGLYPSLVDALIATAYTHVPFTSTPWLLREWSLDNLRAAQSDYEYFETDPVIRAHDMYYLPNADADVVALDNSMAALTPSGEVFSIGPQPSRWLLPTITKPVLLVLAEQDALFPGRFGPEELAHFVLATDKSLRVIPRAGHAFMLQRNATVGNTAIANWLDDHQSAVPHC